MISCGRKLINLNTQKTMHVHRRREKNIKYVKTETSKDLYL